VTPNCQPADCECLDLGDIVAEFEMPRACHVTVTGSFSGLSLTGDANLETGEAVAGATLRGEAGSIPLSASAAICDGETCHAAEADADGSATFVVPVVGDAPQLQVNAEYSAEVDGNLHYYTGSVTIPGCTRDESELAAGVEVELDHVSLAPLASFIASLGSGPPPSGNTPDTPDVPDAPDAPETPDPMGGCGCTVAGAGGPASALWFAAAVLLGLLQRRRRK
jgi:MYXO-CTERM domain-containing protein